MKLIFKKADTQEITVLNEIDGKQSEFSYIEMIKGLIKSKKLNKPDISKGFTEAEIKSINSMVDFINDAMGSGKESDLV